MFALVGVCSLVYMQFANLAAASYIKWMKGLRDIGGMVSEGGKSTEPSAVYSFLNGGNLRPQPDGVPPQGRLPDIILDRLKMPTQNFWYITGISDMLPSGLCFVAIGIMMLLDFVVIAIVGGNLFALNWILNGIAENITILPSSYGYKRCIETRSKLNHGEDFKYEAINPSGTIF